MVLQLNVNAHDGGGMCVHEGTAHLMQCWAWIRGPRCLQKCRLCLAVCTCCHHFGAQRCWNGHCCSASACLGAQSCGRQPCRGCSCTILQIKWHLPHVSHQVLARLEGIGCCCCRSAASQGHLATPMPAAPCDKQLRHAKRKVQILFRADSVHRITPSVISTRP